MARGEELTDEQWAVIEPHLPDLPSREDGRGRPWREKAAPAKPPRSQPAHRRFQQWVKDGSLRRVLEALAEDLRTRGDLDLTECFIDGTFVVAKKGGGESVRL